MLILYSFGGGFLSDATVDLNDLKKRLKNADKKKTSLEKALLDVKKELNNTNRGRASPDISRISVNLSQSVRINFPLFNFR